jgi:amino acid exporter
LNEHLSGLFLAIGIFSVGFAVIGPNILAIIGTSMKRGRHHGMALALGVGVGSGIWATLTVSGMTALMSAYAEVMTVLRVFGVIYLLWLAFKAFRAAATVDVEIDVKALASGNLFLRGLAIQMTNPKAALQWIAIVSIVLGHNAPLWVGAALVASATTLSIAGHLAYAVTFSTRPVIAFYARARRWIEGVFGVFFTFAAFKIATYQT